MGFFFSMQFSLDVYPVGKNGDCFDIALSDKAFCAAY